MSARREDGMSLVELLVVMLLVGIVGGVVTTSLVRGMQFSRTVSERAIALHDVERSLQTVGRELRVADPVILSSTGDFTRSITAQVVRDRTLQQHRFYVEEDGELEFLFQETLIYDLAELGSGDLSAATPVALPRRRLVTDIDNGFEAVFTYHDADGDEIDCDPDVDTDCVDRIARAPQIGIRLIRNLDGQEPIRAETRINVRNLRYGQVWS